MIGLFFEVDPKPGHETHYLETAANLRPALEENGGVLFIDRFRSLKRPGVILSCQHWQDEAHLLKWRANHQHQGAQHAGREIHFADYRIRVAPAIDVEEIESSRWMISVHHTEPNVSVANGETYESVYRENAYMTVFDHTSGASPTDIIREIGNVDAVHAFSVTRDYTMTDRAEAPQTW